MKLVFVGGCLLALSTGFQSPQPRVSAQADDGEDRPLLMAHYMPWYQTPAISGYWGWHWTMDHFDPTQLDADGNPQIASHTMPLTGPYDSSDPAILEYQTLLMKLSGIDGVIVDWYGIADFRDYATLNAATVQLFDAIQRAGLRFIICYEDQTVRHMLDEGYITSDQALARAHDDMVFMQENWFATDAYVKYEGQPILFVYGPQYFRTPDYWDGIFAGLDVTPLLVTLDGHMDWAAFSSFPWPPMHLAGGITLPPAVLDSYLGLFYRNTARLDYRVASAFPAFDDVYQDAGVRSTYGDIEPQDGETLRHTLDLALAADPQMIQLVTWNDYGEGTIIEPTQEFGYQYLEIVQNTRRTLSADLSAAPDDLRLPLALYRLRTAHAADAAINAQLDDAYTALIVGDTAMAAELIQALQP